MLGKLHSVLCPVAFDPNSLRALKLACEIADEGGCSICLFHVVPWIVPAVRPASAQLLMESKEAAEARLGELARENVKGKGGCEIAVVMGADPAAEIIHAVSERKADVVVMATHGRTGLSHFVLGSVAEKVVRECPCPVLTVRGGGE